MLAVLLNGEPDVVRALIEAGADIDAENDEGMTPLMWAVMTDTPDRENRVFSQEKEQKRIAIALDLIAGGANVNITCFSPRWMKWTPLLFASCEPDRNAPLISSLISAGAGVNAGTMEDITPLFHAAAYSRHSSTVRELIRAGAEVNAYGKEEGREGWTPLLYALASSCRSLPVVREILKSGADPNTAIRGGVTPLMFAAAIGDKPEFADVLLRAGADVYALDSDGNSALDCAVAGNYKKIADRLQRAWKNPVHRSRKTPAAIDTEAES